MKTIMLTIIVVMMNVINVVLNIGLSWYAQYEARQYQEQEIMYGSFNILIDGETYNSLEEYLEKKP